MIAPSVASMTAATRRFIYVPVVAGDRREGVLRELAASVTERLDVKHEIEPQDPQQESGASRDERRHLGEDPSPACRSIRHFEPA